MTCDMMCAMKSCGIPHDDWNPTPQFIIAHYYFVKTEKPLVYIAQLKFSRKWSTCSGLEPHKHFFSGVEHSGGVGVEASFNMLKNIYCF